MPTLANLGPQHNAPLHSHSGSVASLDTLDLTNNNTIASQSQDNTGTRPTGGQRQQQDRPAAPSSTAGMATRAQHAGASAVESSGVGVSITEAVRAREAAGASTTTQEPAVPPVAPAPAQLAVRPATAESELAAKNAATAFWLVRASQKVAGWFMGIATAGFLIFYQWVVEPAPPNSLAVRAFAAAAKGEPGLLTLMPSCGISPKGTTHDNTCCLEYRIHDLRHTGAVTRAAPCTPHRHSRPTCRPPEARHAVLLRDCL